MKKSCYVVLVILFTITTLLSIIHISDYGHEFWNTVSAILGLINIAIYWMKMEFEEDE